MRKATFKEWFHYSHAIVFIFITSTVILPLILRWNNILEIWGANKEYFFAIAFWVSIFIGNARHKRPLITHAVLNEQEELQLYVLNNFDIQIVDTIPLTDLMRIKLKPKSFWRMHDRVWLHTPRGVSEFYSCSIALRENIIPSLPDE